MEKENEQLKIIIAKQALWFEVMSEFLKRTELYNKYRKNDEKIKGTKVATKEFLSWTREGIISYFALIGKVGSTSYPWYK